jgi:tetratricopeptide (TPR) repeat protein
LRHYPISGQRLLLAAAALASMAPLAVASAQRAEPVPHLMVTTFAASEPGLGVQAAEAIRSRLIRDFDAKKLLVIPQKDVHATLTASGYSTTEALQSNDARALANLLRADEYMEGTVTKTPTGVKLDARLVLARDNTMQQPLPPAEGNLDRAAQAVAKAYQAARAQLDGEKTCAFRFREGKYKEAEQAARSALSKYPNGTIAGACLANALNAQKQTDSVLAVTQRVIAADPRNIPALTLLADIYRERKDPRSTEVLMSLVAADPSNDKLLVQVINDLALTGQWDKVLPIVDAALKNNPGDPKLLKLGWLVYLGAKRFDQAFATGAEMIKADTSAADTTYFVKMAGAYLTQNLPQKGADVLKQGTAKFPSNAGLHLTLASVLSKAGDNAGALREAQIALNLNPKIENGCAQVAMIQGAMGQSDALLTTVRNCAANGGDKHTLAQVLLAQCNTAYKAGNASKNRADLQKAIEFCKASDQIESSSDAKFLIGVSAFTIGQSAITEAQTTKSCALARLSKDSFAQAQENVPAGLQSYPDAAKQILTAIPQYTPAADEMVKRYCK